MVYRALYRTYRPQKFSDVVGQETIIQTLQNALIYQKVSHAYLFSGPRGTGKTSAAKIFAKTLNCEKAPTEEPCNECQVCIGITEGSIDDVLEIDAASNNGVDEIRELREKVKYSPSVAKYKVYIIDEVHMLSTGAFNALLKTLEEPPSHVIFILATTEPHKIPLTIISRTQRFDFKKVNGQSMLKRMKHIVDIEGILIEEDALKYIAMVSEGGMRDALSILDQAISYSEEQTTFDDVLAITGSMNQSAILKLCQAIKEKNSTQALITLNDLFEQGKEPLQMLEQLLHFYRDVLIYKTATNHIDLLLRTIDTLEFRNFVHEVDKNEVFPYIYILNEGLNESKRSKHSRMIAEMTILKLCEREPRIVENNQIQTENYQILHTKVDELQNQLYQIVKKYEEIQNDEQVRPTAGHRRSTMVSKTEYAANENQVIRVLQNATKAYGNSIREVWPNFQIYLRENGYMPMYAMVANTEIGAASDKEVILSFDYPIHAQMAIQNGELIQQIQGYLKNTLGKMYEIIPISKEQWYKVRESYLKNDLKKEQETMQESTQSQQQSVVITEALRLFGEDLVKIEQE